MINNQLVITLQTVVNIILINGTVVLALLGIHEIGHVIIGLQMGCESGRAVLLDTTKEGPYAELFCPNRMNYTFAYVGSLLASIAFGSMFLVMRNSAERNLFLVILGFSLIFGALDVVIITNTESLFYFAIISGFSLIVLGEYLLTSEYIKRETLLT